jgi:orotate phosphoribosyltransferase
VLEDPRLLEPLARELATAVAGYEPSVVVSAAIGGIVLGYEMGRQLGTKAIFVEKEAGIATLRRGFELGPTDRALVVEDVVTTGGSIREVMGVVRSAGAEVVAVGALVRRGPVDFGVPTVVLLELPIASFDPEECALCANGVPIVEPGSRLGSQGPP